MGAAVYPVRALALLTLGNRERYERWLRALGREQREAVPAAVWLLELQAHVARLMLDINAATNTDAATDLSPLGFPGFLPELRVHNLFSSPDLLNASLARPKAEKR